MGSNGGRAGRATGEPGATLAHGLAGKATTVPGVAADPEGKGGTGGCAEVPFNPDAVFLHRSAGLKDAPSIGWRARFQQRGAFFLFSFFDSHVCAALLP